MTDGLVIHVAGLDVQVGGRLRQRCAWCGALLDDVDLTRTRHAPDSDGVATVPSWPVGALVAVDGHARWVIEHEDGADVPPNCCAALDPEITT